MMSDSAICFHHMLYRQSGVNTSQLDFWQKFFFDTAGWNTVQILSNELPLGKTNNLHRQKQRRRSASR